MRRDELASLGIQLPVLPTIVIGGLPGEPDWAPRLARIGLDVIASGAAAETPETFAAAVAAVPFRPVKATAPVPGAVIVETDGPVPDGVYRLDHVQTVRVDTATCDPSTVARDVLAVVRDDPSRWWVAATDLANLDVDAATARLDALVEGVRQVRLYLAKQQFD